MTIRELEPEQREKVVRLIDSISVELDISYNDARARVMRELPNILQDWQASA